MGKRWLLVVFLLLAVLACRGQTTVVIPAGTGVLDGYATDVDGADIPGASVVADGPDPADKRTTVSDGTGFFSLALRTGVPYRLTVSAKGFKDFQSDALTLTAGQEMNLGSVKLPTGEVAVSVDAISPQAAAIEEERAEIHQRVLGIIPNFYTVYEPESPPLSAKLKFKLALRSGTDPVAFVAAAFVAGIEQASDTTGYVQGAKGFGQRMGATYANGFSDVLIGGAVLPALLHQDPRYFYLGEGGKKKRTIHALSAPFVCRGDNGKTQFNFSSIGGDFASGGLSTLYYPQGNRGASLVFTSAAILTGGRMANALLQEFVLGRFTSRGKNAK